MDVMESNKGFIMYHCLYVGIKTGIFRYINKADNQGVSVAEISKELGLHLDYVQIWFNTALAFGVLDFINGLYSVKAEFVPLLLNEEDVRYHGEVIRIFIDHFSLDMKKQPEYMKSGYELQFSEHDKEFVELASNRSRLRAKIFVDNYLKKNPVIEQIFLNDTKIIDVGCGPGSFLQGIASYYPRPSYIGIDVDRKSIDVAKTIVADNIDFKHGHLEDTVLTGEFDCVIMVLTLHEIHDVNRLDVLIKCNNILSPGGYLLILEYPYPENPLDFSDSKYLPAILDQYFEMIWGTRHLGWSEQESIIKEAGYEEVSRTLLDNSLYMIISARKPLQNYVVSSS